MSTSGLAHDKGDKVRPPVLLVTGAVFGLRMRRLLDGVRQFGDLVKKPVATFSVLDEIFAEQGVMPANPYQDVVAVGELLDGYTFHFELQRRNALCSIARKLDGLEGDVAGAIVRMPATVSWRAINVQFKDQRVIAETIAPDRVVTVINAEWKIKEWLDQAFGKRALELIAQVGDVDIAEILQWIANEVSTAEDWADWCTELTGKTVRHHVVGAEAPSREDRSKFVRDVDNILKAATTPLDDLPSFYASYSMTQSGESERRIINDAVWRMREHGLVIDPGTIEIGTEIADADRPAVHSYTVLRDLRWDVRKVDVIAAIHPYTDTPPPLSTGMMDELGNARAYGTDRYLVLPRGGESPFTAGTYIPFNHHFKSVEELFAFFEKKRRPPLQPRWADQAKAFAKWAAKEVDERAQAADAAEALGAAEKRRRK
jgi:hypothetical protein